MVPAQDLETDRYKPMAIEMVEEEHRATPVPWSTERMGVGRAQTTHQCRAIKTKKSRDQAVPEVWST